MSDDGTGDPLHWDAPHISAERAAADAYLGRLWHSDLNNVRVQAEIGRIINIILGALTNGAGEGKEPAIALLLDITLSAASGLNSHAIRHATAYRQVAQRRNRWPVIVTPHADSFTNAKNFTEKLKLGTTTGIGYRNRRAFRWKDEKEIAASLYLELLTRRDFPERYAIPPDGPYDRLVSSLPILTRKKALVAAWWKAIQLLFEERYGPAFETHPAFARHWSSPTFAPRGGDNWRAYKQSIAAFMYGTLGEWRLYGARPRAKPRRVWRGHDASVQARIYPAGPKGSWQHAAVRLPALTNRESVVNQWFEAALLLNRDPVDGYSECFSHTEFARYMTNALRKRNRIRKHIKDLLQQAVVSIAAEPPPHQVGGT